ncbi:HNH endonuclease [Pedobacter sp. MC2016-24]|uniref:HNH endonuclease n=1 Tax=Pedobacter sp. MC2016-24 TaxID=2780090 RepID=UPI0018813477|nr:HNH endonuclease [Pedobacter sp. MC2016-24]MBE9602782.1 HNH endonuclease [Pedobacter sp. MC2016-24]
MIKLFKTAKPQVLIDNGSQWTMAIMQHITNGTNVPENIRGKYRHVDIKNQVIVETNGKCAYCESYVTHQYPGDIEHIIPKSIFPRLTFTWNNLSFVCYWCNNHKRNTIDKKCKLLNPYTDNIDEHLRAFGPIVMHVNSSKRGELTHLEIKLNRKELIERRVEAIKALQNLIDKYERETIVGLKEILRQEIIESSAIDKEFSLYLNQYLTDRGIV